MRELLLKRLIHVFLQIRRLDIFYNCCLKDRRGQEGEIKENVN